MTRVTKSVEERRQEIIDTARTIFTTNGYDNTQVADISKKMDVAAGTIYHYFKSKTEILYAVIDELADEKMREQRKVLEGTRGSAISLLKTTFKAFENDEMHDAHVRSLGSDPAIIQYFLTKMSSSYMPILISFIEKGNTDGSWGCEYPKETAVFILQGMTAVLAEEHLCEDSPKEKEKRIRFYQNIVFRALGAAKTQ